MTTTEPIDTAAPGHARFTRMDDSTVADWRVIGADFARFSARLPDRVLAHLMLLDGDYGGFPVDRLTHSLQTATRAAKAGRDDEYVALVAFSVEYAARLWTATEHPRWRLFGAVRSRLYGTPTFRRS